MDIATVLALVERRLSCGAYRLTLRRRGRRCAHALALYRAIVVRIDASSTHGFWCGVENLHRAAAHFYRSVVPEHADDPAELLAARAALADVHEHLAHRAASIATAIENGAPHRPGHLWAGPPQLPAVSRLEADLANYEIPF